MAETDVLVLMVCAFFLGAAAGMALMKWAHSGQGGCDDAK